MQTLRKLRSLVKRHNPLVVFGDPDVDLQAELYKLANPDAVEEDPLGPSEGMFLPCLNRRKMRQLEKQLEDGVMKGLDAVENLEKEVEKAANKIGDAADSMADAVENSAVGQGVSSGASAVAGAGESVAVGAAGLVTDMITSPTALAKQDQGGVAISHDPGSPRLGDSRDSSESPRPSTDSLAMEVESGSNGEGGGSMEVESRPTDKERKKQDKQRRKEEKRQKKRKDKDPPPMEEVANPLTEAEDPSELET